MGLKTSSSTIGHSNNGGGGGGSGGSGGGGGGGGANTTSSTSSSTAATGHQSIQGNNGQQSLADPYVKLQLLPERKHKVSSWNAINYN